MVTYYKYLGILIEENLSFKSHLVKLVSKLKLKLGFFFRNKLCFSLQVRKHLISTTFLPLLDYGDLNGGLGEFMLILKDRERGPCSILFPCVISHYYT